MTLEGGQREVGEPVTFGAPCGEELARRRTGYTESRHRAYSTYFFLLGESLCHPYSGQTYSKWCERHTNVGHHSIKTLSAAALLHCLRTPSVRLCAPRVKVYIIRLKECKEFFLGALLLVTVFLVSTDVDRLRGVDTLVVCLVVDGAGNILHKIPVEASSAFWHGYDSYGRSYMYAIM